MRQIPIALAVCLGATALIGCVTDLPLALVSEGDDVGDIVGTVLGAASSTPDTDGDSQGAADIARVLTGSVGGDGDYRLFELGDGIAGDEWSITPTGAMSGPYVVVLFDGGQNLLMRTFLSYSRPLTHVLREDTDLVYLGIMAPGNSNGGDFQMNAVRRAGRPVPAVSSQLVWLNFAGGSNIRIHNGNAISFPVFDAAVIGEEYAGHSQAIKDMILAEMQADYASYNVTILSSDHTAPPAGEYSSIHFGGGESGLLGLADNVDNYNRNPTQSAIIYVENFAPYWTMQLDPDEMAVMIANVASHELGHLLGLYHTRDPDDLMDTTGSAWDLAENQSFMRTPLEPTVFAIGWENSPRLLEQILGFNADAAKTFVREKSAKSATYKAIRRFAQDELTYTCGTCLSLNHE